MVKYGPEAAAAARASILTIWRAAVEAAAPVRRVAMAELPEHTTRRRIRQLRQVSLEPRKREACRELERGTVMEAQAADQRRRETMARQD
jgi:hypothetical protein